MFGYCSNCDHWVQHTPEDWGDCALVELNDLDPTCLMEVTIWIYDPADGTFVESRGKDIHAGLRTHKNYGCPNHRKMWPNPPITPENAR